MRGRYAECMVSATLQRTVAAMSPTERAELRDYIDITLGTTPALTEQQKASIRARAAQMEADPSIGLDWDDVYAELMADLA